MKFVVHIPVPFVHNGDICPACGNISLHKVREGETKTARACQNPHCDYVEELTAGKQQLVLV